MVDKLKARRGIHLAVYNHHPNGIDYGSLDRLFSRRMPEIIYDHSFKQESQPGECNYLMVILREMSDEGVLMSGGHGRYIEGPNFPTDPEEFKI